jgi:exodeoxyribonuclease V gamma subunit
LLAAGADYRAGQAQVIDVAIPIGGARIVTGTVGGVHGSTVARTVWSNLGAKHRLRAWVQLLALAAARPDTGWRAVTIGKGWRGPVRSSLAISDSGAAIDVLQSLAELYVRGLQEPLPLPLGASLAYADVRFMGDDEHHAIAKAQKSWKDGFESDDRDHRTVWGPGLCFDDVLAQKPTQDDQLAGLARQESTRFGALACRLWFPLLAAESLERL